MKNANLLDQFILTDQIVVKDILATLDVQKDDVIFEVGAGNGVLTQAVAEKAGKIIAVEIDGKFKEELSAIGRNCRLIFADALEVLKDQSKYNVKFNKIVGSLPSLIVEPLIKELAKINFEMAVFLVPLRFVNKLKQSVYFGSVLVRKVDRHSFYPVPKTNWALIKIIKKENLVLDEFLRRYVYEHPLAKKENALREGLISYYKAQGKKLTKNQARNILKSEKPAESAGFS